MTFDELLYLPECTAGVYAALEDEGEHAGPVRIFLNKQIQVFWAPNGTRLSA